MAVSILLFTNPDNRCKLCQYVAWAWSEVSSEKKWAEAGFPTLKHLMCNKYTSSPLKLWCRIVRHIGMRNIDIVLYNLCSSSQPLELGLVSGLARGEVNRFADIFHHLLLITLSQTPCQQINMVEEELKRDSRGARLSARIEKLWCQIQNCRALPSTT